MLAGKRHRNGVGVGLLSHEVVGDGAVACNSVNGTSFKLHNSVRVVGDGVHLAAGERGSQSSLAIGAVVLEKRFSSGTSLGQNILSGQVSLGFNVGASLYHNHLAVIHIRLGERVIGLAAFHGEAVPQACDSACLNQRVLSVPVDCLSVELPAITLSDLGSKVQVKALELAVIAHVAVRRILGVKAHHKLGSIRSTCGCARRGG